VYPEQAQACCGAPGLGPIYDGPRHNWRVGEDHGHLPSTKLLLLLLVVVVVKEVLIFFFISLFWGYFSARKFFCKKWC
jgi:hypothetical protein